jgi:hypothetical protein
MRSDWTMTRLETALFITGITLMAGGFAWAAGTGRRSRWPQWIASRPSSPPGDRNCCRR